MLAHRLAVALLAACLIGVGAAAASGDGFSANLAEEDSSGANAAAIPRPETSSAESSAPQKPNIVVFLLDDTSPHDGRLWSDPNLTPTLYDRFIANGVHFPNAIAETPLCCPARASILTGLHTHNHGVKVNDARLFNPQEHLGTAMGAEGYATMWIGKYLNKVDLFTPEQWSLHSAPWTQFDVFANPVDDRATSYFTNYTLFTKQGLLSPPEHSTQMIADRAVAHITETPPEQPVFAVLSIYNTHAPHIPLPAFNEDPRCDDMPPWNPPNYNEADVSDKPGYVRERPLYPYPHGWPLEQMCEEMLGVDWAVERVTDELAAQGRLDNTLLVFTADNGMDWGSHRLELKQTPYSVPIPLYFSWPARWGSGSRTIDAYVSNIDVAPTLCVYAGCTLGPFPGGQDRPDGVSLRPLLDGTARNLTRDALLETSHDSRVWVGVRTTDRSDLGLWHYVEYANGFKELYDLQADPYELENVASLSANSSVKAALRERLTELLTEGRNMEATASIKIVQDTLPNSGQDFAFTGDLGSFALDDDSNATLPRSRTFSGLTPGSYTFYLADVEGYVLTGITCPPLSATDLDERRATVQVLPGDSLTCTFKSAGRRPDASIAVQPANLFKGNNIYSTSPEKSQTQRWDDAPAGQTLDFTVALQNDAQMVDSFTVKATETGSISIGAAYLVDGLDVTSAVLAGTYIVNNLGPGAAVLMTIRVTVAPDAPTSISRKLVVRQTSVGDTQRSDVVRAVITR